jgi:nucleotide-binding universal stress UspA family protein
MKKVLIAIDLSPCSLNAALYGMELYGRKASYTLLHCYDYMVSTATRSEEDFAETAKQAAEQFKTSLLAKLPGGSWNMRVDARPGFLDLALKTYSEQTTPPMLVIMGADHPVDEGEKIWAPLVIERSGLPVLIVPPKAYYQGIRNILLADDGGPVERADVAVLRDLHRGTQARVHMLHVVKNPVLVTDEAGPSPMERALGHMPHTYKHRSGDDLVDVVKEATAAIAADLVVVTHHERSFLERMFHASVTARMAQQVQVPLLCLQQRA